MKEGLQALLLEQRLLFAEKEQQLRLLQGLRRSLG
jgi:hypothetical protein